MNIKPRLTIYIITCLTILFSNPKKVFGNNMITTMEYQVIIFLTLKKMNRREFG